MHTWTRFNQRINIFYGDMTVKLFSDYINKRVNGVSTFIKIVKFIEFKKHNSAFGY